MRRLSQLLWTSVTLVVGLSLATSDPGGPAARAADAKADEDLVAGRRRRARQAGKALRQMVFFERGRGVHALPLVANVYQPGTPGLLKGYAERSLRYEMGFQFDRGRPIGLEIVRDRGVDVPVVGCAGCHAGRAAGITIEGLGNKTMDVGAIGRQMLKLAGPARAAARLRGRHAQVLTRRSLASARNLADPRWANPTQGLVPVFLIANWLYGDAGQSVPACPPRMLVKIPHLWGLGPKIKHGLYVDGFGQGVGWLSAQESTAGQRAGAVRAYVPRLRRYVRLASALLPPRYPFAVDRAAARRGAARFREACVRCHGTHAQDDLGFPIFEAPQHADLEEVGTDPDRFNGINADFARVASKNPLADLLAIDLDRPGYLAPRLDGIWARFPYLHNGAVPNLLALLTTPAERPGVWSVKDAGERHRFDPARVGLTVPASHSRRGRRLRRRAGGGDRSVYDTRRRGHGNQGHTFGTDFSPADKRDLLEYLKTL